MSDLCNCRGYRPHPLGTAWYTVITPTRELRRYCDGDCLALGRLLGWLC
jgi:hypothetical protein